jgi:hypothetical protein
MTDPAPVPLARDEPSVLATAGIGEAWLAAGGAILAAGVESRYDSLPVRELSLVTLVVAHPDPEDAIIARHADPGRLAWMKANFTDRATVAALGDADSYATRLFDYGRTGRDQVAWVIDRLRRDPSSRSATITTFQPLTAPTSRVSACWTSGSPAARWSWWPTATASTSAPRATATWSNWPRCRSWWPPRSAARRAV